MAAYANHQREQLALIPGIGSIVNVGQCVNGNDAACNDIWIGMATDVVAGAAIKGAVIAVKTGGKWVVNKVDNLLDVAPNRTDEVFETGANITPNSTLDRYTHIGADGTFVTETGSIENVIGRIPDNATEIRITRQQADQLEVDLGLNPGSLEATNTLSLVDDISSRCPRCPIGGNDQFLGGGQGLPGGGAELVIDSIPSSGGEGIRQITVIVE